MVDIAVVVTSTTVFLPAYLTLGQADKIAEYIVYETIVVSSWACSRGVLCLWSGRHD